MKFYYGVGGIYVRKLMLDRWKGVDNSDDICLHGETTVKIGSEIFKYNATVSATALYLLKTLTNTSERLEQNYE